MRTWLFLLSGLLVWTAHFFGVYIAASLFPGTSLARWLTLALTLLALVMLAVLGRGALQARGCDPMSDWVATLALGGIVLSGVAVLYQGAPALL